MHSNFSFSFLCLQSSGMKMGMIIDLYSYNNKKLIYFPQLTRNPIYMHFQVIINILWAFKGDLENSQTKTILTSLLSQSS